MFREADTVEVVVLFVRNGKLVVYRDAHEFERARRKMELLVDVGLFHMLVDLIALVPLLERFEVENGTLLTVALFYGGESDNVWLRLQKTR